MTADRRSKSIPYFGFPKPVLRSPAYIAMSYPAKALLIDLRTQYNGHNNGNLHCAWSLMSRDRGWRSRETLYTALQELIHYGFLKCVRHGRPYKTGGTPEPNLFALTWERVDRNADNLASAIPTNDWQQPHAQFKRKQRKRRKVQKANTEAVLVKHGSRACTNTEAGQHPETDQRKIRGFANTAHHRANTEAVHLNNLPGRYGKRESNLEAAIESIPDDLIREGCQIQKSAGCKPIGGSSLTPAQIIASEYMAHLVRRYCYFDIPLVECAI